jgi:nucleoside phosphorylase
MRPIILSTVERATVMSEDQTAARQVDFVILAPLKQEREAVFRQLPPSTRLDPSHDDANIYHEADLPVTFPSGKQGQYRVIVVSPSEMGRVEAATTASNAIRTWTPRYVLVVGIAGGVPSKQQRAGGKKEMRLGDVLIANQIVDYEHQKLREGQRAQQDADGWHIEREIRWQAHQPEAMLLTNAQYADDTWQELINVIRPTRGKPKTHFGTIATGDKSIAAQTFVDEYRDVWPKLIGVEMEAGGVATAALRRPRPPGVFMVRSVSDFADAQEGSTMVERWRPYACDVAASFAIALLQSGPVVLSAPAEQPTATGTGDSGDADALMPDTNTGDSGDADILTLDEQKTLADLLRRSGRADYTARTALCQRIGIEPGDLGFLAHASANDFAAQLVNYLSETGNVEALRRLCQALEPILKGSLNARLQTIYSKL